MVTIKDQPYSIVALATAPTGIVSGSIMLKGETHSIEYREGDVYSLYKVTNWNSEGCDHPSEQLHLLLCAGCMVGARHCRTTRAWRQHAAPFAPIARPYEELRSQQMKLADSSAAYM